MARSAPARLTLTEAAVLGLLVLEGERSGYDLLQLAHKSVGHVWSPAKSQLYATLDRLDRHGLALRKDVAQAGRPDKQLYRVSAAGRRRLDVWLSEVGGSHDEQVLKLFFGGLTDPDTLIAHVEHFRADAVERLEVLRRVDGENTRRGQDFFHGLVLDFGLVSGEAAAAWAERTLITLEAKRPVRPRSR